MRIVEWMAAAVLATGLCAGLYLVVQQSERQGADDAPTRLVSQVAAQLAQGGAVDVAADDPRTVDMAASDEPFFVVYDSADRPVAGSGRLNGALAVIPSGVLAEARRTGADHVTWQTSDGRRFATVERRAGDDVVLGAQSLAPTEDRIDRLGLLILVTWLCLLAVVVVGFVVDRAVSRPAATDPAASAATTAR